MVQRTRRGIHLTLLVSVVPLLSVTALTSSLHVSTRVARQLHPTPGTLGVQDMRHAAKNHSMLEKTTNNGPINTGSEFSGRGRRDVEEPPSTGLGVRYWNRGRPSRARESAEAKGRGRVKPYKSDTTGEPTPRQGVNKANPKYFLGNNTRGRYVPDSAPRPRPRVTAAPVVEHRRFPEPSGRLAVLQRPRPVEQEEQATTVPPRRTEQGPRTTRRKARTGNKRKAKPKQKKKTKKATPKSSDQ